MMMPVDQQVPHIHVGGLLHQVHGALVAHARSCGQNRRKERR